MAIRIKRIYDDADDGDGYRVLVDRLWPRGIKKADAELDAWARELAPSDALRKWFGHDADKLDEFKKRYAKELDSNDDAAQTLDDLKSRARDGRVTLLYAAKDTDHNNAVALKEYLES
ncbi:MAG: DUF488 family protein [Phycisphaerae bacterium]|nr:DUF488 family protein [Phycisphaerae bacterium]